MTPTDLRTTRKALGLSQAALAERLGVARGTLNRWERGVRQPEHPELLRLALERLRAG